MDKTKKSFIASGILHISIAAGIIYFINNKEKPAEKILTIPIASFQEEQIKPEAPRKENKPTPQHAKPATQKQSIDRPMQKTSEEAPYIENHTKQEYATPVQTKQIQKSIDETKEYIDANFVKIREAIAKYKRYPASAVKMGCEGVCVISFKLNPTGGIEDIKIAKSSGFTQLDRSSIQTVEDAACEMPKPHKSVLLIIPIEYKLN